MHLPRHCRFVTGCPHLSFGALTKALGQKLLLPIHLVCRPWSANASDSVLAPCQRLPHHLSRLGSLHSRSLPLVLQRKAEGDTVRVTMDGELLTQALEPNAIYLWAEAGTHIHPHTHIPTYSHMNTHTGGSGGREGKAC